MYQFQLIFMMYSSPFYGFMVIFLFLLFQDLPPGDSVSKECECEVVWEDDRYDVRILVCGSLYLMKKQHIFILKYNFLKAVSDLYVGLNICGHCSLFL